MSGRPLLAVASLTALLAGCAHGDRGLYGSYVAHDMALEHFQPPVTLTLARSHQYRFCVGQQCSEGRWFIRRYGDAGSRMVFTGREFETWMRTFLVTSYGNEAFPQGTRRQGEIETDYGDGPIGMQITLGAGDAAFVKE